MKNKSNKWKRVVWSYLVDTTRLNCFTICEETNSERYGVTSKGRVKVTSFEFGVELARSLIMPWMQIGTLHGLTAYVRNVAFNFSSLPRYLTHINADTSLASGTSAVQFPYDGSTPTKLRCRGCIKELQGPGYCSKRDKAPLVRTIPLSQALSAGVHIRLSDQDFT